PVDGGPSTDGGVEVQNASLDHACGGPRLGGLFLDRPITNQPHDPRLVVVATCVSSGRNLIRWTETLCGRSAAARRALARPPKDRPGPGRPEAGGSLRPAPGAAAPAGSPNSSGGSARPVRQPPRARAGPGTGGAARHPAGGRTD